MTVHITFTASGAPLLRRSLKLDGRKGNVIAFSDDLSFGPINPPDPIARARWVRTELGYENPAVTEYGSSFLDNDAFWSAALHDDSDRIAWTSRLSTSEYSGFLEFVYRLGDLPCSFIDLTDVKVAQHDSGANSNLLRRVRSVALNDAPEISKHKLVEFAKSLTPQLRDVFRSKWEKLRSENSGLRVLDSNLELISAPISYFDDKLLSFAGNEWKKSARVIGEAMIDPFEFRMQVSDFVLTARLEALVEVGKLEGKGDIGRIRYSEVRLPQGK